MTPVEQIIQQLGGVTKTARAFGIAHPNVIKWRERGRLPAERIPDAVRLTGIPAATLRPDLAAIFATHEVA